MTYTRTVSCVGFLSLLDVVFGVDAPNLCLE